MAPTVAVAHRDKPLRAPLAPLATKARWHAAALARSGAFVRRVIPLMPLSEFQRKTTDRIRATASESRASLAAGFSRVARIAAPAAQALASLRRRIRGIRLPEIPGGDPVMFGAATGVAIILGAGLVVLVNSALREYWAEPQTVTVLSGGGRGRLAAEDRQALAMHSNGALRAGGDTIASGGDEGRSPGSDDPADLALAPGSVNRASPDALADEDENIAAALPLLDMPPPRRAGLPPALSEPPVVHTPDPLPETRPPAPPARPQWLANAVEPPRRPGERPMIAIVIDDAGVAEARTSRAIELPAPLTIAFIPYSRNLEEQTRQARRNGHELLLHIPMEPDSNVVDPGPNALLTSLDSEEIMRRFEWALARFDGYVGVNNHMGSKFMARPDLVAPLLEEMNARGLMFLDSRTDKSTVGAELALEMQVPHASRQVFLDNDLDEEKIAAQLQRLESMAQRRGHAIAIGHPHDVTVDVLARWIPDARARGFDLVPVSAIVKLAYGDGSDSQLAAARGGEADGLLGSAQ